MRTVMIITRAKVEPKRRAIVIWRAVIDARSIIRIPIPRRPIGRVNSGLLIHVEIDSLGNAVFRAEPLAGSEKSCLFKLVRRQRQGPDHIVSVAEVVKRSVRIAEYLQMHRCVAHVLTIGFDSRAWLGSLDQDVVGHGAVRSALRARGYGLTSGQKGRHDRGRSMKRRASHSG